MSARKKSIDSDLARIDRLRDEDIDYSDIPPLGDEFLRTPLVHIPHPKQSVTIRFDREVIDFFKQMGRGYQTKMNAILKAYVHAQSGLGPVRSKAKNSS